MMLHGQYIHAYNFGQKVVVLATETVGLITAVRETIDGPEFRVDGSEWLKRDEIEDYKLWRNK